MQITVIGSGVIGLSAAIRLQEAGHAVTIVARDFPPNTTSNRAAAIWYPFLAFPKERVLEWSRISFDEFVKLSADDTIGVWLATGIELFETPTEDPWWKAAVTDFRHARSDELPSGYADGHYFETPVIEMPRYLPYLLNRYQTGGGKLVKRELASLDELAGEAEVIINCTGLGARQLVNDTSVYPVRGQTVLVKQFGHQQYLLDDAGRNAVAYIIPRSDGVLLGGVAQPDNWNLEPDAATAEDIVRRCANLLPELAQAEILQHSVGLRPARPAIRLEAETLPSGQLCIHNYGHGGSGVTISWGCAAEVVQLLEDALVKTN